MHFLVLKILCDSGWSLDLLKRYYGQGFNEIVSEFLIARLGIIPEVRGQVAIGLGDGVKGGLSTTFAPPGYQCSH